MGDMTLSENTYTAGFIDNFQVGIPFVIKVKGSGSLALTWTNSSSTKRSTANKTIDSLTIGQPSSDYNGPTLLHLYEDRIYKTYAFTLDWDPSCADSCGGQSPAGCYCDEACSGYGDCCPDKLFFCGP